MYKSDEPLEQWSEEYLIISLLKEGPMSVGRLKARLKSSQQVRHPRYGEFPPHSNSTYDRWIKRLEQERVINESNGTVQLSEVGRWIACSELGRLAQRKSFIELVCRECWDDHHVVVFRLVEKTRVNSKGYITMTVRCPKCGVYSDYSATLFGNERTFVNFYNNAVEEMRELVQTQE